MLGHLRSGLLFELALQSVLRSLSQFILVLDAQSLKETRVQLGRLEPFDVFDFDADIDLFAPIFCLLFIPGLGPNQQIIEILNRDRPDKPVVPYIYLDFAEILLVFDSLGFE